MAAPFCTYSNIAADLSPSFHQERLGRGGQSQVYEVLQNSAQDDDSSWNMLLLREYDSLASMEANEEKADTLSRQVLGQDDSKQMQGYGNRSKTRQVLATKTMRELTMK